MYVYRNKERKCVCKEIQSFCVQRKREMERECVCVERLRVYKEEIERVYLIIRLFVRYVCV